MVKSSTENNEPLLLMTSHMLNYRCDYGSCKSSIFLLRRQIYGNNDADDAEDDDYIQDPSEFNIQVEPLCLDKC